MTHDVFLSYSPGSQKIAEALTVWLEQEGFRCFVAFREIGPGEQWVDTVPDCIKSSRVFVSISAPDAQNAAPVYEEISIAIENSRPILPFKLKIFTPEIGHAENWPELPYMTAFPLPQKTFGKITRQLGKLLIKNFADQQPGFPLPLIQQAPPAPPQGPFPWILKTGKVLLQMSVIIPFLALLFAMVPLTRSGNLSSWRQDWKEFLSEGFNDKIRKSYEAATAAQPKANAQAPALPSQRQNTLPAQSPTQPIPAPAGSLPLPSRPEPQPPVSASAPPVSPIYVMGTLKSVAETPVFAGIHGKIVEIYVTESDTVEKGKVLAKIENSRLNGQIEEALNALTKSQEILPAAEKQLLAAKAVVERNTKRREETGGLSPSKLEWESGNIGLEKAVAALASASAIVEELRVKLEILETEKAAGVLRSPVDGIVLKRSCNPGQVLADSVSLPELFLIASPLERLKLHCNVSEKAIAQVAINQEVSFQTADFPGRAFTAKVTKIGNFPAIPSPALPLSTDGKTPVFYPVELLVENPGKLLRPGTSVLAQF